MKKKRSPAKVLASILDWLDSNAEQDVHSAIEFDGLGTLRKEGRASLKGVERSMKAASEAAKASGKSGRTRTYDREAILADTGTHAEIAGRHGCSTALVSKIFLEAKKAKEATTK